MSLQFCTNITWSHPPASSPVSSVKGTRFDHSHVYVATRVIWIEILIITLALNILICFTLNDTHQHLLGCQPVKTFMGAEPSPMQAARGCLQQQLQLLGKNHSWCLQIMNLIQPLFALCSVTINTASASGQFTWKKKFSQTQAQSRLCWISWSTPHRVWDGKHHVTWLPRLQCVQVFTHLSDKKMSVLCQGGIFGGQPRGAEMSQPHRNPRQSLKQLRDPYYILPMSLQGVISQILHYFPDITPSVLQTFWNVFSEP